jgi:phosphate transport system permease protein
MSRRRQVRKVGNAAALCLSLLATLIGLFCLGAILWTLIARGMSGMSVQLFTQMTPPPGGAGGLLNAIYGSIVMTVLGMLIGAPIGILAGTYLAEYGRDARLSNVIRFVNDVLLSAPSIIIGLFVYEVLVVRMGHFSAIAGAVALAIIAIPVTVRTTEDMLRLVPQGDEGCVHCAWRLSVAHDHEHRLPGGAQRHRHGPAAGGRARQRRNGAAALHGAQQPVLEREPQCADRESAGRDLPVRLSPYKDWQQLAWSGALLITLAILALSVIARLIIAALPGGTGQK